MKLNAMENFQFQHFFFMKPVLNKKTVLGCQHNTLANTGCLFLIQKHKQQSGQFGG